MNQKPEGTRPRADDGPPEVEISTFFDGRRVGRLQLVVFVLCGTLMFFDGFDTQMMSYAGPHVAQEFGLSKIALGQTLSAALGGLMAGYLIVSPLSSLIGHKRTIFWSALSFGVFSLFAIFSSDLVHLVFLRFLSGVGLGAMAPSAITLAGDYMPRRFRASSVLFIYCFFSFGFVAAGLASGLLIEPFGWRSLFIVGGVGPFIVAPLIHWFLPDSLSYLVGKGGDQCRQAVDVIRRIDPAIPSNAVLTMPEGERSQAFPLGELFNRRYWLGTVLLWGVFTLNLAEFYGLQTWLPTILTDLNYDLSLVVLITSMTTVGGIAIAFVVGPAMDRFSAYNVLAILYAVGFGALCLLAATLQGSTWLLVAAAFLGGCCVSGGQKSIIALAAVFYPAHLRSTGIGWGLGIGRIGGMVGPLAMGGLLQFGVSPHAAIMLGAVPMLVMAAAVMAMRWRYAAKGHPSP